MATSNNINFDIIPIVNRHWSGNIQELANLLAEHMIATFDNGAFIGQDGGLEPTTDIGIWVKDNIWYGWNALAGKYLPFPLVAASQVDRINIRYTVLLNNARLANLALFLPDETHNNETLATLQDLQDVQGLNSTETASGTTITLDFSKKTRFWVNLSGDTTINRTGDLNDGQIVDIYFQTNPSSGPFAITWNPSDFYGVTGTPPTSADSSHFSITRARAHVVGNSVYVAYDETFTQDTTADVLGPKIVSIKSDQGQTTISLEFDELVTAATLSASSWRVTKNGNNNLVSSAVASGKIVTLTVANSYQPTDNGTVTYTGTDLKDVSGNAALFFGASYITINPVATLASVDDPSITNLI